MWYVIQVINGREDVMRERIERMVPAGAMQELFYPQFQTEIKVHDQAALSRISYLRYGRSPHCATASAAHGRLCPGVISGWSVCAAGKRRGPAYWRIYA